MLEAAAWGLVGGSSLLVGALLASAFAISRLVIGLVLGFGAGALISAISFELTEEAFELGGADVVAAGLAAGALVYFAGDWLIEGRGGMNRMSPMERDPEGSSRALLLGAVLDGVPESAVIGTTLVAGGGIGVPVVAAVFLSNLPESLSASSGMLKGGHSRRHVLATWTLVVLVCAVSAALGYALLDSASGEVIGLIQAFTAGAVLTMLADTMMPEAFEHGGRAVGLATVLGFALAYLLSTLD